MRLTDSDRAFVRAVAGRRSDEVETWLADWPMRLLMMCPIASVSRPGQWYTFLVLVWDVVAAAFRRVPHEADSVFYEPYPKSVEMRKDWFAFFSPGRRCEAVTATSRILRTSGLHPARFLFAIAGVLMRPDSAKGVLSGEYVKIARWCLMLGSHATASGDRDVYLLLPYRQETPFYGSWLMNQGIRVHLTALTTPFIPNNLNAIADDVILCNPFQADEIEWLKQTRSWPPYTLWGPADYPELHRRYGDGERRHLPGILGVYTQGYRVRVRRGSEPADRGTMLAEHEEGLYRLLRRYVDEHPDVRLRVFPHPCERQLFLDEGLHFLHEFDDHARIRIDWSGAKSSDCFDDVGLGLTTSSTCGFDRLFVGFPTLFLAHPDAHGSDVPSRFSEVFMTNEDALYGALDVERQRTPGEFMEAHFGGHFEFGPQVHPAQDPTETPPV